MPTNFGWVCLPLEYVNAVLILRMLTTTFSDVQSMTVSDVTYCKVCRILSPTAFVLVTKVWLLLCCCYRGIVKMHPKYDCSEILAATFQFIHKSTRQLRATHYSYSYIYICYRSRRRQIAKRERERVRKERSKKDFSDDRLELTYDKLFC